MRAGDFTVIDKIHMPHVMAFICHKLADYDTSLVEWIKLLPLNKNVILHGCCDYPVYKDGEDRILESGYRLRASVNVESEPPYLFEHWGRVPSRHSKQGWTSGLVMFRFDDLEDCAVHTLAHECFHFLGHSRQVRHKNTEANANWWADQWLAEFQNWAPGAGELARHTVLQTEELFPETV